LATGGSFSPGNYPITYVSNDIQVDRAMLTVIANNVGKVYGLALINGSASTGFNVQGLQNGETAGSINFFYAPGNLTTAPVGVYPGSVIPSALTGGTFNENNYTINYILGDLLISGAPLIIAVDNVSKVYGSVLTDGPTSAGFTAAGLQNGETIGSVTIATSTGSLANAPVGTYNGLVTATNATGTFAPGNYIITYTAGNITITPAKLVITAKNANKIYRDVLTGGSGSNEFTSTPLPNGETVGSVTISYGNGAAGGAVIGSYKGSVVPSAATGNLNVTNYEITYIPGDLTVDPPPTPLILTFGSLLDLATTYGTPSTTTSLTISGTHMAGGILVTAPAGFEVSMDDNIFAQTITVGTVGSITNTKLYIRLAALASVGTYSGNVVMTSSGAIDVNEPLPLSKVSPAPLTIATINKTKAYGETLSNQAQSTEFTISGLKNSENVSSINLNYAVGAEVTAGVNTYIGSVMPVLINGANGFNVNNYNVTYIKGDIIVEPATITITARKVTKYYGAVLNGGPGLAGYIVTAGILKNNEKINSITITFGAGASASDGAGNYAASVTQSAAVGSSGFANENYNITYIAGDVAVLPVTLTIKADDKIKEFGVENPLLTVKYLGFVNGENESVLSSAPFLITTAEMRSPIGQYPIYAGGASAANYDIKYLQGLLTISGDNIVLEIPNTITPNGDGINDTWNIKNLDAYPNTTVDIFDRSGHKVFTSVGYGKSWDGTFNGAVLPSGVYYYVINTKTLNAKVVSGHITVLK
jgi:gliding motility-associated-like protein